VPAEQSAYGDDLLTNQTFVPLVELGIEENQLDFLHPLLPGIEIRFFLVWGHANRV
jgi:hypothetical protein